MKRLLKLLTLVVVCLVIPSLAFASGEGEVASSASGMLGIGAGLGLGLAAVGGAYSQSRVISAALESIGRNPAAAGKMFMPWVLGCVFIETLVIFTFVISIFLQGKI